MTRDTALDLLVDDSDPEHVRLLAPAPGRFTCALPTGTLVAPEAACGVLLELGRATPLRIPAGVQGRIQSPRPERVHAPVGYRDVLYELAPLAALEGELAGEATAEASHGPVVRSPQSGRFYHRPSPDAPAFVEAGDVVEEGTPVGMIEVMKTFTHVPYSAAQGLPARAKVVALLAGDGAEVHAGEPLLEIEPA